MSERRLILMRHSKAERYGTTDRKRPLSNRGHRDANDAGQQLAALGVVPDLGMVSTAVRTKQTWMSVASAFPQEVPVRFDETLYGADADDVLETIRLAPEDVHTLMLVGHNPAFGWLTASLDDGGQNGDLARSVLGGGFATSALAVFDLDDGWEKVSSGACRLVDAYVGRG